MTRVALIALTLALAPAVPAAAQMSYGKAPRLRKDPALPPGARFEPKLGQKAPLDLEFYDHTGTRVSLRACVGDKPTVLVMAYYGCPKLCTEVLNGLKDVMRDLAKGGFVAGKEFNVVTVSINPKEAPEFAFAKRHSYLQAYDGRGDDEPGWWFLTANAGQGKGTDFAAAERDLKALGDGIGFGYAPADPKAKEYVHPNVVTVLAPDGTVCRYFTGFGAAESAGPEQKEAGYVASDLRKALVEASGGTVGTWGDRIAMLCFAYDEHSETYKPVMRATAVAAVPFAALVVGIAVWTLRRARAEGRLAAPAGGAAKPSAD